MGVVCGARTPPGLLPEGSTQAVQAVHAQASAEVTRAEEGECAAQPNDWVGSLDSQTILPQKPGQIDLLAVDTVGIARADSDRGLTRLLQGAIQN